MHATAAIAPLLALCVGQAAAGGFFQSCPQNSLYFSTLNAVCNGRTYQLQLNDRIANQNGNLVYGPGGFYNSCGPNANGGNCWLDYSTLKCDCSGDAGIHVAEIDLNPYVTFNGNGINFD